MAEAKKSKRRVRPVETVRQKAEKASKPAKKPRRIRQVASTAGGGIKSASSFSQREYHPIKLPDNWLGRFLTKRRYFIPRFFRESWQELKLVTWPNRSETAKLTFAVLVFAFVFGGMVAIVDYGLEKLFRDLLLK